MNAKQFAAALKRLDLPPHYQAGKVLGIGRRSIYRFLAGEQEVPVPIERLITLLEQTGVPEEWR